MPDVTPGKEEEFRRLQRSLALSDRLDHLIEATESPSEAPPAGEPALMVIPAAGVAGASRGLRAGFASRLARLALALHRQAAADAVLRPSTFSRVGPDSPPYEG